MDPQAELRRQTVLQWVIPNWCAGLSLFRQTLGNQVGNTFHNSAQVLVATINRFVGGHRTDGASDRAVRDSDEQRVEVDYDRIGPWQYPIISRVCIVSPEPQLETISLCLMVHTGVRLIICSLEKSPRTP
jgi:hypothetical protein